MIDEETPYAPPKSALEDLSLPEMIVKPTKMQRLFRVVLFPVLLPMIATVLYSVILFFAGYLDIKVRSFTIEDLIYRYVIFFLQTMLQSFIFSLILEFFLLTNRNKNIYSLCGGFLIGFSVTLLAYILGFKGVVNERDIIYMSMIIVAYTVSSYLTTLILNRHISYYNKKIVQAA